MKLIKTISVICSVAAVFAILIFFAVKVEPKAMKAKSSPYRSFATTVGEDMHISRSGLYGIDLISIGSCRIEKRKLGKLTLGAFNILVLKDLDIVMPREYLREVVKDEAGEKSSENSAAALAQGIGLGDKSLEAFIGKKRFSGLDITNLSFSTLEEGTNIVRRFSAARASGKRKGLQLEGCAIFDESGERNVGKASLILKPALKLVWDKGEMEI